MNKEIRNEIWSVNELVEKINNNKILVPKYQRTRKWTYTKNSLNLPNLKEYIEFLYKTKNSSDFVKFKYNNTDDTFHVFDGNNRCFAIKTFVNNPYTLFNEYYDDLEEYLLENEINNIVFDNIKELKYTELLEFNYRKFFTDIDKELYKTELKQHNEEIGDIIDIIKENLKVNGKQSFTECVKINILMHHNYDDSELCSIFHDINKYYNKFTDLELFNNLLYYQKEFKIDNNIIEKNIINELDIYYKNKNDDTDLRSETQEISCINAFEFIIGFQNYISRKCDLIEYVDGNTNHPIFFKLYKLVFNIKNFEQNNFTSNNVNKFIRLITKMIEYLQTIINDIFDKELSNISIFKLDNRGNKLTNTNIIYILIAILSYIDNNEDDISIINKITLAILTEILINEIKLEDKTIKKIFKNKTFLSLNSNEQNFNKVYLEPNILLNNISKDFLHDIFKCLFESNKEYKKKLNRRELKFYEKILLLYYFKLKIPSGYYKEKLSIEHIIPFSTCTRTDFNIERLGSMFLIPHKLNIERSNKHISIYIGNKNSNDYIKHIDYFPSIEQYNNIIEHGNKPKLINEELYNEYCDKNEIMLIKNFIEELAIQDTNFNDSIIDDTVYINELSDINTYSFTKTKILSCKLNNIYVKKLSFKNILYEVYFLINDIEKVKLVTSVKILEGERKNKGFYYIDNLNISVQCVSADKAIKELLNQCNKNNIAITIEIKLINEKKLIIDL